MNLHTGTTVWELLDGPPAAYPPLAASRACDVTIVGGGISGATIGLFLARAGLRVVLLDRRQPLAGSSLACTALLQYELDVPLRDLRHKLGGRDADRAYAACYAALKSLPALAASVGGDVDLVPRRSLYLAGDAMGPAELRDEVKLRNRLGIDCHYLDGPAVRAGFGVAAAGAIVSDVAYEVDPVRFTRACLAEIERRGGRVFGQTELLRHEADGGGVRAVTAAGFEVRSKRIVYATGYEAPEFLGFHPAKLNSTWAVASPPNAGGERWPGDCLMWQASDPYCYLRTTRDGRVIVGGEDEPFQDPAARDALTPAKVDALRRRFAEILPGRELAVDAAWAGTFATTADGLPCVGEVDGFPGGLFALGYGGNGVLFSVIAAGLVRDALTGRGSDVADLFAFGRASLGAGS